MRTAEEQRRKAVRLTSPSGFGSEGHDKLSVQRSTRFLGRPNNKTQCGVWGVWASVGGQQTSVNKRSVHLDKTQIFSFFLNVDALMELMEGKAESNLRQTSASREDEDQNICI